MVSRVHSKPHPSVLISNSSIFNNTSTKLIKVKSLVYPFFWRHTEYGFTSWFICSTVHLTILPTKSSGIKLEYTQRFDVRLVNIFIVLELIGRSMITEKLHDMTPNEILLVQIQHIYNIKISIRLYCSALMTFSCSFFVSPSIYGFIICSFVLWCWAPFSAIFYGASNLYFDKTSLNVTLPLVFAI